MLKEYMGTIQLRGSLSIRLHGKTALELGLEYKDAGNNDGDQMTLEVGKATPAVKPPFHCGLILGV